LSHFVNQARDALIDRSVQRNDWNSGERPFQVVTLASNKGGVGKTTVAANLAVYVRALHDDLPVLLLGFDDQPMLDWMFGLEREPPRKTVVNAVRSGDLRPAIRLGQYGVHYLPSARDVSDLKRMIRDPFHLQTVLQRTQWNGLVIIDTKSDLEILTRNAIAASDLTLVVVKDRSSLAEAEKVFDLLKQWRQPRERARVLLSLVDLRVKYHGGREKDVLSLLLSELRKRRYPLFETFISRSPKIESLYTNPEERPLAILAGAPESIVHQQMRHLTVDVLSVLAASRRRAAEPLVVSHPPAAVGRHASPRSMSFTRPSAGGVEEAG
jgi:cellulose biosynthesis protein BcsQ